MLKAIIIFAVCSLVNVMLNTIKTIIMYRQDKLSSASINAITYGFYTLIVVLMADPGMNLWVKMALTALTNFIGVWASMVILDTFRKDKLWKVEATIPCGESADACRMLDGAKIPYNTVPTTGDYKIFNIFCATQEQSHNVREILKQFNAKYFVSESKNL